MSTITIRLPEKLKARVTAAAKRSGTTTHNFILDAIAKKTEQNEPHADFDAVAENRYTRINSTGKQFLGRKCVDSWRIALLEKGQG